jgi:hypothetical protein
MKGTFLVVAVAALALLAAEAHAQSGRTIYTSTCATAGCHASNPLNDNHATRGNRLQNCARPLSDLSGSLSCLEGAAMLDGSMSAAFSTLTNAQLDSLARYLSSVFYPPATGSAPACTLSTSNSTPIQGRTITLTASCTNSPTSYTWTNCTSTTSTCTTSQSTAGTRSYSVTARNAVGTSAPASVAVAWTAPPPTTEPPPPTTTVVEYLHAGFGHYFITGFPAEIGVLDSGAVAGWARTGRTFKAYTATNGDQNAVCRFFTAAFAPKSSHFYTPSADECNGLKSTNRDWQYEADAFWVQPTDAAGTCPAGTEPVYRLYNNGQSGAPNHRYTTDRALRAEMMAGGWVPEGYGPESVAFCAPQ